MDQKKKSKKVKYTVKAKGGQGRIILKENNIPYSSEKLKELESLNPSINFQTDFQMGKTYDIIIPQ
jgi:hypothetical protein